MANGAILEIEYSQYIHNLSNDRDLQEHAHSGYKLCKKLKFAPCTFHFFTLKVLADNANGVLGTYNFITIIMSTYVWHQL